MAVVDPRVCPLCEQPNGCAIADGKTSCWCASLVIPAERLAQLPAAARGRACICRRCAETAASERPQGEREPESA